MDKKMILFPLFGMIGALVLTLLITFPILSMTPKDIPVGVISLDRGITTPAGDVNAGDKIIKKFIKSDNDLINFQKEESSKKLKDNLENGKYYATITVPKDFTKSNGNTKIKVVINEGLNPMVTMSLSTLFSSMGEKMNMDFDISSIHSVSSLGIKAMLMPMMLILITFVTSLIVSFLITNNIKDNSRFKEYLFQLLYLIVMAFIIGFIVSFIAITIAGVDISIFKTGLYLSLVSISLMLLVNGVVNLFGKKGIIIPMILFVLGMGLVQIPYEYINGVWQVIVASWEPFRYVGIGIREVLYQGHGVINKSFISLLVISIIGLLFSIVNITKKKTS